MCHQICSNKKKQRFDYVRRLQFTFPIYRFRLTSPQCYFVWKLPENQSNDHESINANIIQGLTSIESRCAANIEIKQIFTRSFENKAAFTPNDAEDLVEFIGDTGEYK